MKKRILCTGLVLAFTMTIIIPAAVTAKGLEDFHAEGTVTAIDQGDVKAAGRSERWVVQERHLIGEFTVGPESILGSFTMTYHANVESTDSQASRLQGVLTVGEYELNVTGSTVPAYPISGAYQEDITIPGYGTFPGMWVMNFMLELDGTWAMTNGSVGNGIVDANIVIQICVDNNDTNPIYAEMFGGHIVGFPAGSSFALDGHWKP